MSHVREAFVPDSQAEVCEVDRCAAAATEENRLLSPANYCFREILSFRLISPPVVSHYPCSLFRQRPSLTDWQSSFQPAVQPGSRCLAVGRCRTPTLTESVSFFFSVSQLGSFGRQCSRSNDRRRYYLLADH